MVSYSLSQFNELIGQTLAVEFSDPYWIRAEIASLSCKAGHGYFDLVEKGSDGILAAKQRATCWANTYSMLSAFFAQEAGTNIQVGMQVLLQVEVNWHDVYGLSLNIINIDPQYTVGDLARQKQETIRQLKAEGILDMQQTLVLPTLVRRIAIISSDSAAGYEDFINQLNPTTSTHTSFLPQLFTAVMQGDNAESSILKALAAIAEQEDEFDAVAIIRGGGASTDMSCFDSYLLAATCAQFPLPILTGIGHTRDVSVMDLVAYKALKTPTAVAAFLADRLNEQRNRIEDCRRRLQQTAERQILIRKHVLEMLAQRIIACNPERIYRMGYSLTTVNGKPITSTKQVRSGQAIITHLSDGEIESIIK